jgi:hypothetical protein
MSDTDFIYADGVFGRELSSGRPEGHLADLDTESLASDERLEVVRSYWPEVHFSDYDVLSERLLRHRESGREYRIVGYDPLQSPHPEDDEITGFMVFAGRVVYIAPRVITSAGSLHTAVIAGEVRDGGRELHDAETGVTRFWNRKRGRFTS